MGLDFWAVKIKNGITKEDFKFNDYWDLVEDDEFYDLIEKEIKEFKLNQNDKVWYRFCIDTVGCFVGGDPIHIKSQEDIDVLTDKLNEFIKENPDYEYKYDDYDTYSNEDVKRFIKYINLVRNKGFVLWCSW